MVSGDSRVFVHVKKYAKQNDMEVLTNVVASSPFLNSEILSHNSVYQAS